MYGEGISKTGELLDLGVNAGVVEKSGSWYSYGDERIGQGRENAKIFLSENPDIAYELEDKIRAAHGLDFEKPSYEDDGEILEPRYKILRALKAPFLINFYYAVDIFPCIIEELANNFGIIK